MVNGQWSMVNECSNNQCSNVSNVLHLFIRPFVHSSINSIGDALWP